MPEAERSRPSEEANAEAAETERGRMIDLSAVDVSMALCLSEDCAPTTFSNERVPPSAGAFGRRSRTHIIKPTISRHARLQCEKHELRRL
ncbi:hypothetical protein CBS147353_1380 [Aspergillus niger]|nr:hypothetical protein CBS147353_1380 [Aspergillus niger]